MKQEMRKLNRAKYAYSEEEVKQLTSQGFVPVGRAAEQAETSAPISEGADDGSQEVVQEHVPDGETPSKKKRKDTGKE